MTDLSMKPRLGLPKEESLASVVSHSFTSANLVRASDPEVTVRIHHCCNGSDCSRIQPSADSNLVASLMDSYVAYFNKYRTPVVLTEVKASSNQPPAFPHVIHMS
jgi:hypothetical protein